jgi:regulator of sigma E protease
MLVWLAPIVVFGLVVFVHELGHFIAAKLMGVYAPRFSIGFGPALLRKRWGETEYQLAALPLGGFVRMASKEDEDIAFLEGGSEATAQRKAEVHTVGANDAPPIVGAKDEPPARPKDWDPEAMVPFGPKPIPPERFFESKPLLARLFILIAGVTMNVVLSIVVMTGLFAYYGRPSVPTNAEIAPVVDSVVPAMPAAQAGLRRGDSIVTIAGAPARSWADVVGAISTRAGQELELEVARGAERRTLRLTPNAVTEPDPETGAERTVGKVGLSPRAEVTYSDLSLGQSAAAGWRSTWSMAAFVTTIVKRLFTREVSMSNLGGPIAIARQSVQAARGGVIDFFSLLALLSVNIAVLNLLPIPILDGGQIVMQLLEAAKGSPFSDRTREYLLRFGLAAIILLFVVVMWNDITRLFS